MRLYGPPFEPAELKIEVTRSCPLACVHCSSNAGPGEREHLSPDLVHSLIDQASKIVSIESIVISGGEPLVWPWLGEAVAHCREMGFKCILYTTGNGCDAGATTVAELTRRGLSRINFSLYSAEPDQHERFTMTPGSFQKTLSAIAEARSAGVAAGIHFVPVTRNYQDLEGLVCLAEENGIETLSVLRFVPQGRGAAFKGSREMLGKKKTLELRRLIMTCRERHSVRIRVGSPYNILLLESDVDCKAAKGTMIIGPTGNLYPCDAFKNIEPTDLGLTDPFHNVRARPLADCWQKSSYLNAIRRYLSTPFDEPCRSCSALELCKSGCLAQKVLAQESIGHGKIAKMPDPLCVRSDRGADHVADE